MPTDKDLESDGETAVATETDLAEPRMFKVLMLNDDYTTMDFVVYILESVFAKSPAEAVNIMLNVHKQGQGLCGVYARQIAEAKILEVHQKSREENYPLRCVMEEA